MKRNHDGHFLLALITVTYGLIAIGLSIVLLFKYMS